MADTPARYRDGDELPVWDDQAGRYVDPATGEILPDWDEALDAIGPFDLPWHVARFGTGSTPRACWPDPPRRPGASAT